MTTQLRTTDTVTAADIMTAGVKTLLPQTPIPEAINDLLSMQYSEMPIVDESGVYVGMFSERCCMRVLATLAELPHEPPGRAPTARDVMVPRKNLLLLGPEQDVHTAMELLLERKCSGAPVIDSDGRFLGVFSEKTCMGFIIEAAYNGLPGAKVHAFIDSGGNRLTSTDADLHTIARLFMELPYGRLPIMNGDELVGQVSRRDVLHHAGVLACILRHGHDRSAQPVESSASPDAPSTSWLQFPDTLSNYTVMDYADDNSQTISADMNLFSIARLFLVSSFRRFPVLRDGRLIGQISRCDLLREVLALTC